MNLFTFTGNNAISWRTLLELQIFELGSLFVLELKIVGLSCVLDIFVDTKALLKPTYLTGFVWYASTCSLHKNSTSIMQFHTIGLSIDKCNRSIFIFTVFLPWIMLL